MTTIAEDYVSFETAKLLKEKGFDARCPMLYTADGEMLYTDVKHHNMYAVTNKDLDYYTDIIAPTQSIAMKWLREVHNINIDIVSVWNQKRFEYQIFIVTPENAKHCYVDYKLYLGYEEACEAAIKYCLENLI